MAWSKINAFCLDLSEQWVFLGNISGQIHTVEIDALKVMGTVQAHGGTISAMTAHPSLPLIAALGMDQFVTIWRYSKTGELTKLHDFCVRDIACEKDKEEYLPVNSESQAIAFHSSMHRLVTRSGNGGVLEIDFDDADWKVARCFRVHEKWDIATVRYLVNSDLLLVGMHRGFAALCKNGSVIRKWRFGDETVHWFELYKDGVYLVASDSRSLFRLDPGAETSPYGGIIFAKDDFEHVTYNHTSGRAYASSFDRNVYEVDPITCLPLGVAYTAPFKNRWIKTLERNPSVMLVQCRNGGLYKVDLPSANSQEVIKETPNALWTAVKSPNGTLLLAGDGTYSLELTPQPSVSKNSRKTTFKTRLSPLATVSETYTKRMVIHDSLKTVAYARTDGEILVGDGTKTKRLVKLDSAVRDLAFHPNKPLLFACCEDGRVLKLDIHDGRITGEFRSNLPVWALAYNTEKNLLAISERMGELIFLNGDTLDVITSEKQHRFAKRLKWIDNERLLYGVSSGLWRYDLRRGSSEEIVPAQGNTLEDFAWDLSKRYLAFIGYTRNVTLCDFESGAKLNVVPDQMDYSKGIYWLDSDLSRSGYPYEFLTFGRAGIPHLYQVHDGKILSFGPATTYAN